LKRVSGSIKAFRVRDISQGGTVVIGQHHRNGRVHSEAKVNRHDRRKANKGKIRPSNTPKTKTEIYSMSGKNGEPLMLDVAGMRLWGNRPA
jgi:hypothetical protein